MTTDTLHFEELDAVHALPFRAFAEDLRANDARSFADLFPDGFDPFGFAAFVRAAQAERLDWRPKARQTSRTRYVLRDAAGLVGFATLQFPLSAQTADNFLFVVPPARRGRGFGTLTLNRLLFEGARAGLARARVSCLANDPRARRCIELNRGEIIEDADGRAAYWIRLR